MIFCQSELSPSKDWKILFPASEKQTTFIRKRFSWSEKPTGHVERL
jgi:hypothetical protein